MADKPAEPSIDYATIGAVPSVQTRIIVDETPESIRFTDPPGSPSVTAHYTTFAVLFGAVAVCVPIYILTKSHHVSRDIPFLLISVFFGLGAKQIWGMAREFATLPTIIEVSAEGLSLTHPDRGFHQWRRDQVSKVYCDTPMFGSRSGGLNSLTIVADGKFYNMLNSRPSAEIRWLADQINKALQQDWRSVAKPEADANQRRLGLSD